MIKIINDLILKKVPIKKKNVNNNNYNLNKKEKNNNVFVKEKISKNFKA